MHERQEQQQQQGRGADQGGVADQGGGATVIVRVAEMVTSACAAGQGCGHPQLWLPPRRARLCLGVSSDEACRLVVRPRLDARDWQKQF